MTEPPLCFTDGFLKLLPQCLAAAHAVLGVHPFPRLDVLIVPAGFSSLGMASPHIIFLSQSVLSAGSPGSEESLSLCGSRICHEISHSWFGLVIGARDWTEEWISEGFATCLEDIIWAQAQQLSLEEKTEQFDLKALLRWRRLSDELQNSKEELQILRPNMEKTGQVSESGSSTVKHALNPEKPFMQVHYLKGYFLLKFLASQVGEQQFIEFFQLFVKKYHGHLILSQVRLETYLCCYFRGLMLLELLLEESELSVASLRALQRTYSLQNQDAEVRHRWCELVVKHAYAQAYGDVEHFLIHDQVNTHSCEWLSSAPEESMTQTGRQRGDDKWVWEEERRKMCHKVFTVAVTCVCGQLGLIFLLQLSNVCLYNTPFPFSVLSRFPAHCLIVLHLFAPF
uniref:Aminopeptidase O (putative) n=1 Tax=Pundamilia nyererei TaxID=303518 RepID=A0A3B4FRA0_9CICH